MITLSLLLAACGSNPAAPARTESAGVASAGYADLSPAGLADMLTAKDFLFVNTHVPYEGEIDGTDAFIPYEGSGPQRVGEYPADKAAKIVVYCRSGRMSEIVAEELVAAGYTNVWNLTGGMVAWEAAGYELKGR
jgi:rhodanese-related sulfurtransferase